MKEILQIQLKKTLDSGDIQQLRKDIRSILMGEIMAIEAPLEEKNKIIDVIQLLELPIKTSCHEVCLQDKTRDSTINVSLITASVSGAILSTLLRRVSLIPSMIISIGGAAIVGYLANKKLSSNVKQSRVTLVETIDTSIDEIVKQIDRLANMIILLLRPNKVLLDHSFPNIIKWYQEAYASCDEFGEECSAYFKKRIVMVLNQCFYTLHDYDGKNDRLFRKNENINIKTITQNLPAITNDNGYILLGSLSIPKDK